MACIREKPEEALRASQEVHEIGRADFGLPPEPPSDIDGITCGVCSNNCKIGKDNKGYCGLVSNKSGVLIRNGGTAGKGILQWYYDSLPTNCVASWFCPECIGASYPKYAIGQTGEEGLKNLAVFYGSCSLDCLFCQNWHYRNLTMKLGPVMSAKTLAAKVDDSVSCICFFGGDPSSQMPHALKTSELSVEIAGERSRQLRICWETNGFWKRKFALKAANFSLASGGNIKFDLKTWSEKLSKALCGVSNKPVLESFRMIGKRFFDKRPEFPVLTASTLMIPGYVDVEEIEKIATFIAEIDPLIPYTLLAFSPQYTMSDLPATSLEQARRCYDAASKYLSSVKIGNVWSLE